MRVFFSDFFEISPELLDEYGAFNISLLNDLPLFIDPFLIFCSEKDEYKQLHKNIIRYLKFLKDQAQKETVIEKGGMKLYYLFPEVKQTYLGFCTDGNAGRGLGKDFAYSLHSGLRAIFSDFGNEKITKSTHVEKLCLIKPNVGRDCISDFVTNLIKDYLLSYTELFAKEYIDSSFCKEFSVENAIFDYDKKRWIPRKYYLPVYNGDFVLLTPTDLLVGDDTWINKQDLYSSIERVAASLDDDAIRYAVNDYFHSLLSEKPSKKEKIEAASKTILKYPELIDYYIKEKEECSDDAILKGIVEVKDVELVFKNQVTELIELLDKHTDYYKKRPDSHEEALQRVNYLKHVIENCDGYRLFYDKGKPIRREKDLHIMYKLVSYDTYCSMDSEVNNGRGPVDFKASNSRKDATLIEFKLAKNLKRNLGKQVDVYKDANQTDRAIIVVVYFEDKEYDKAIEVLNDLGLANNPDVVLIDARGDKVQASKAK